MRILTLKSLGLRSLKRINDGGIYIAQNQELCYHHTVNWTRLFGTRAQRQRQQKALDIRDNQSQDECSKCVVMYLLFNKSKARQHINSTLLKLILTSSVYNNTLNTRALKTTKN